jgi:hypothetical protein
MMEVGKKAPTQVRRGALSDARIPPEHNEAIT